MNYSTRQVINELEDSKSKYQNLEDRTFEFAKEVRIFIKTLDITIANIEDSKQLIRSSGSVGANYIEANESLSDKDFIYRIRITRKEAKESIYWMRLIKETNEQIDKIQIETLIKECNELKSIFSSILKKVTGSTQ